ncbi:glycoside hydrolase family 78 protein [Salinibacterium sp. SYSU T00001]|uniref:alpha-L-rhamnosidase n=1 Tax=Homoserinimonas sedimenticola TaxID=2986805 RepID=UPI0022367954|nr:alpha-L-rhamnosidase [Salinibacterium sedimenticola]MCW4386242.1 glycoside hydrolase family 78 protein [Salinibacterium sedimenticola]
MPQPTPTPQCVDLRAEYGHSTCVAVATPRLSWKTVTDARDWVQASAEIEIEQQASAARITGLSVTVDGAESVFVEWPFEPLTAGETATLRVRTTGADGVASTWSEPLTITSGLVDDWAAHMIGAAADTPAQPARLRREFEVRGEVARATLHATAHGAYQVEIGGVPVDDHLLKPGWTAYQERLVLETTDVTSLVARGSTAIGVELAGAWYTEEYGFGPGAQRLYGEQPAAAVQLVIEYVDGASETIVSDASWRASTAGPLVASGLYAGETYDARREQPGWSSAGFGDSDWAAVRVDGAFPTPEPRSAPPVRVIQELPVAEVITTPSGATVLDFGQNLVGGIRLRLTGTPGDTVTLTHAEVLEHGELGTRPLRRAAQRDEITLGEGELVWQPRFTFHGFRYVQVDGLAVDPADVTALVIHSDMPRTGWFESSDELVNRLHENVVWGMRGNFLSLPTDCPQRDERMGWTGDVQVFAPTASFLYDCDGFLASWLRDLEIEQRAADGAVTMVVPNALPFFSGGAAAWGDAATVVPDTLFARFGDRGVLEVQYESMKAWVDFELGVSSDRHLWEGQFQFGDWLDPDAPADSPAKAKVDSDIVASAYLFHSLGIVARAASVLGRGDDAERYAREAALVRAAFRAEYVTPAGRLMSDAQTAYALAIMFGLADEHELPAMGARLATLVREAGYRIGTGFVGTPLVAPALTLTGHADAASRLLLQTEDPSWLYPVTMGATTVWERWDSMLPDGTINPGEMTSFNHYALGSVADWLHTAIAGLAPAAPGYRMLRLAPTVLPGLDHARAEHETPYGRAAAGWARVDGSIEVTAVVPPNTRAQVLLPGGSSHEVGSGAHSWTVPAPAPTAAPGPVHLGTPLADIVDDREAYAAVVEAIRSVAPDAVRGFTHKTVWGAGRPIGAGLFAVPFEAHAPIAAALDAVTAARISPVE